MEQLTEDQLAQVPDEFELTSPNDTNFTMEYWWSSPGGEVILQYSDEWYLQAKDFEGQKYVTLDAAYQTAIDIMRGEV